MRTHPPLPLPAARVYLVQSFARALSSAMVFTVSAVYAVTEVGLNPLQLVLIGTVLEASAFLFEVPTGVMADVYSRRMSVIVGVTMTGVGFLFWGAVPLFATILAAQVVWGIGITFASGAEEAWIADEVGEARVGQLYLRQSQAAQFGALLGIGVSVALASVRLNLPMLVGGVLYMLTGLFLWLAMPEIGFRPDSPEGRSTKGNLRSTLAAGLATVRSRPTVLTILAATLFYGAASEAFDRFPEAHLLARFTFPRLGDLQPVVWFGVLSAGALVISIVATEVARRRLDLSGGHGVARVLAVLNGGLVVAVLGFALANGFALAVGAYWLARFLRRLHDPITTAWLNQGLDPRVRATVNSLRGQTDALGQIAGGPVLGVVATAISIPAALIAVAVTLLPTVALYARAAHRTVAAPASPAPSDGE